eukprot:TCONS_00042745-protein
MGRGCFMAKVDIKHAFRLCPVHPDDWPMLGYKWLGKYFFDIRLPFGLRSSPLIFNTFADALTWILVHKFHISAIIHYLDDFFVCAPTKQGCQAKVNAILSLFRFLGVPVADDKLEGPSQCLVFLGIEIDSVSFTCRLPSDKLSSLHQDVELWLSRRKCTKRELLSFIGSLSFVCKVIKPGRIFLRRLIGLSTSVSKLHHHIDISVSVRRDISMWATLLSSWNGISMFQSPKISSQDIHLFTDASSSLGMGAFFHGMWFSVAWPVDVSGFHIGVLELFAVYSAILSWGPILRHKQIVVFTDNSSIMQVWETGSSKDEHLMKLVRLMFFLSVDLNLSITLRHVPGHFNVFADLLSRLQVSRFLTLCPDASPHGTNVPLTAWEFFR